MDLASAARMGDFKRVRRMLDRRRKETHSGKSQLITSHSRASTPSRVMPAGSYSRQTTRSPSQPRQDTDGNTMVSRMIADQIQSIDGHPSEERLQRDKMLPLHRAAMSGDCETVRYLLREAKVNVNDANDEGWTALHWSSSHGHNDVAIHLIGANADVNYKTTGGETPLHVASTGGYPKLVEHLANAGADPCASSLYGWTPLHNAAYKGHVDCVKVLLRLGAPPDAENFCGNTPLDVCSSQFVEIVLRDAVRATRSMSRSPERSAWPSRSPARATPRRTSPSPSVQTQRQSFAPTEGFAQPKPQPQPRRASSKVRHSPRRRDEGNLNHDAAGPKQSVVSAKIRFLLSDESTVAVNINLNEDGEPPLSSLLHAASAAVVGDSKLAIENNVNDTVLQAVDAEGDWLLLMAQADVSSAWRAHKSQKPNGTFQVKVNRKSSNSVSRLAASSRARFGETAGETQHLNGTDTRKEEYASANRDARDRLSNEGSNFAGDRRHMASELEVTRRKVKEIEDRLKRKSDLLRKKEEGASTLMADDHKDEQKDVTTPVLPSGYIYVPSEKERLEKKMKLLLEKEKSLEYHQNVQPVGTPSSTSSHRRIPSAYQAFGASSLPKDIVDRVSAFGTPRSAASSFRSAKSRETTARKEDYFIGVGSTPSQYPPASPSASARSERSIHRQYSNYPSLNSSLNGERLSNFGNQYHPHPFSQHHQQMPTQAQTPNSLPGARWGTENHGSYWLPPSQLSGADTHTHHAPTPEMRGKVLLHLPHSNRPDAHPSGQENFQFNHWHPRPPEQPLPYDHPHPHSYTNANAHSHSDVNTVLRDRLHQVYQRLNGLSHHSEGSTSKHTSRVSAGLSDAAEAESVKLMAELQLAEERLRRAEKSLEANIPPAHSTVAATNPPIPQLAGQSVADTISSYRSSLEERDNLEKIDINSAQVRLDELKCLLNEAEVELDEHLQKTSPPADSDAFGALSTRHFKPANMPTTSSLEMEELRRSGDNAADNRLTNSDNIQRGDTSENDALRRNVGQIGRISKETARAIQDASSRMQSLHLSSGADKRGQEEDWPPHTDDSGNVKGGRSAALVSEESPGSVGEEYRRKINEILQLGDKNEIVRRLRAESHSLVNLSQAERSLVPTEFTDFITSYNEKMKDALEK